LILGKLISEGTLDSSSALGSGIRLGGNELPEGTSDGFILGKILLPDDTSDDGLPLGKVLIREGKLDGSAVGSLLEVTVGNRLENEKPEGAPDGAMLGKLLPEGKPDGSRLGNKLLEAPDFLLPFTVFGRLPPL